MASRSPVSAALCFIVGSALGLCLIGVATVSAGDVIFNELGQVGAPASYGHLTFGLRAGDLKRKYSDQGWRIFSHYLEALMHANHTNGCELELEADRGQDDSHRCSIIEVRFIVLSSG
jgi:hypothetical protein